MKTRQPLIVNWPEWKAEGVLLNCNLEVKQRWRRFLGGLRTSETEPPGSLQQVDTTLEKPNSMLVVALRISTGSQIKKAYVFKRSPCLSAGHDYTATLSKYRDRCAAGARPAP